MDNLAACVIPACCAMDFAKEKADVRDITGRLAKDDSAPAAAFHRGQIVLADSDFGEPVFHTGKARPDVGLNHFPSLDKTQSTPR